jgi:Transposase DNA-binding/Transposase Tn5 dimerisation domain
MIVSDNEDWVEEQFGGCRLGDQRRTKRLQTVVKNMLEAPEKSLPRQNVNWSDVKGAYRLFDSQQVTFQAVCEQHWRQTRQTKPGRYLLISDTTDINRYTHYATTGLGMLGDGKGRGMQLHNCLVYNTDEKLIAGSAGAVLHYRSYAPKNETRAQRLSRVRESELWGNLVTEIGAPPEASQWIHVFDRGGDNFEAMCRIRQTGCDWIIRAAKFNRQVLDAQGKKRCLAEVIQDTEFLGSYDLHLRSRPGVKARAAHLRASVARVTFPKPKHRSPWVRKCGISELTMNVVIVQESSPPQGVSPVCWVLLTSLPVESFDDVWQVIEDYECRWLIEEYHKVIKTGCNIEGPALRTAERLEPLMGLISVVGIRLFQMKLLGRSQRKAKAKLHVPCSWLKCLKLARPKVKLTGMTVYEFFRELAKMGGFLGRKHDGEPGWQTVWEGFQKMQLLLAGLRLAGAV